MRLVYADVVLLLNFFVDFVILYLAGVFLHFKIKIKRLLLSSLVGSVFSLVAAILEIRGFFAIILSLVVLFFMCRILFGRQKYNIYIKACLFVLVFSLLLCGVVSLYVFNFKKTYQASFFHILLFTTVLYVSAKIIGMALKLSASAKLIEAKVRLDEIDYKLCLLCDSGNVLLDIYTSMPVIVVNKGMFSKSEIESCKPRFIPVRTVENEGLMLVISPKSIVIDQKNVLACIGFSNSEAGFNGCDGIVPSVLVQDL